MAIALVVKVCQWLEGGGLIGQQAAGLDGDLHVRKDELSVWQGDGLAELDAVLGVGDGLLHSALGDAQALRGDADTAAVQSLHGDLEAWLAAAGLLPGTMQSVKTSSAVESRAGPSSPLCLPTA